MASAKVVAQYMLSLSDPDVGDIISHLKLQKLLYYAQGFHLALYGSPLFDEPILAWDHGPVVRSVFDEYRQYGAGALPVPEDVDFDTLTSDQQELLNEVYTVYGQYSAWRLRQLTHDEPPWKGATRNGIISHSAMSEYFKTLLIES